MGGVSPKNAITSWQGPLNGVQDFEFGSGAIEVKTTISTSSFLVNIGSLDQLDDSKKCPLFICGIRLALSISGITICDLVNELRELLSGDSYVKWLFDGRLVQAGYFDSNSDSYTRRFLNEEKKVFQVTSVFPHLTRMSVPIEIKSACYEIDLNMLSIEDFGFKAALKQLGVIE